MCLKMEGLFLQEPKELEYNEIKEPDPKPGEALLKVHRIGICGSDVKAYEGKHPFLTYPRILGHELGCEVLEVNPGEKNTVLEPGDSVTVEPLLNCGECYSCKKGDYNCCKNLRVVGIHEDGGMREKMGSHTLPRKNL